MINQLVFVLGADDPEMQEIEALAGEVGAHIIYASTVEQGRVVRCHPGNVYSQQAAEYVGEELFRLTRRSDVRGLTRTEDGVLSIALPGLEVVVVEGARPVVPPEAYGHTGFRGPEVDCTVLDHHRPGDPGFGLPPERFLEASSLGQVVSLLARRGALCWATHEITERCLRPGRFELRSDGYAIAVSDRLCAAVPRRLVAAAAADHCLAAAYQGECPRVTREDVIQYRAEVLARRRPKIGQCANCLYDQPIGQPCEFCGHPEVTFARIDVDGVRRDIEETARALGQAPLLSLVPPDPRSSPSDVGHYPIRDTRPFGHLPEIDDAACLAGVAFIAGRPGRTGTDEGNRIVIGGCTTPEMVRAFMEVWAHTQGLTGIYGDPERGFAGGYVS